MVLVFSGSNSSGCETCWSPINENVSIAIRWSLVYRLILACPRQETWDAIVVGERGIPLNLL